MSRKYSLGTYCFAGSLVKQSTCRCLTVKMTGSDRYTLLLSLLIAAVMTGELTMTDFMLAFSVER
uniref:Uncharacterized protein n=1 Tax=Scleropages formosus TaxID=113540 RepID=A0A8C9T2Y4_SCLFO